MFIFLAVLSSTAHAGPHFDAYVKVPARQVKHELLVDVMLNGRGPYTFLIDTGASGVAFETSLAPQLGIRLDPGAARSLGTRAGGEEIFLYQTHLSDVSIGSLAAGRMQAAALPLTAFGDKLGEPLHGILGAGFLRKFVTRFDFTEPSLAFAASIDAFHADLETATYRVPLRFLPGDTMPLLEVRLNGQKFDATIDTGSAIGVEVFTPYVSRFGLDHALEQWTKSEILGGSIGEAVSYDGHVELLEIGPMRFPGAPASITPPRFDEHRQGNLGNQLWQGYALIIDYPGREILFRRISPP